MAPPQEQGLRLPFRFFFVRYKLQPLSRQILLSVFPIKWNNVLERGGGRNMFFQTVKGRRALSASPWSVPIRDKTNTLEGWGLGIKCWRSVAPGDRSGSWSGFDNYILHTIHTVCLFTPSPLQLTLFTSRLSILLSFYSLPCQHLPTIEIYLFFFLIPNFVVHGRTIRKVFE